MSDIIRWPVLLPLLLVSVELHGGSCPIVAESHVEYEVGGFTRCVVCADLNLDGVPDVASNNRFDSLISLFINDGSGGLTAAGQLESGGVFNRIMVASDLNGDGISDLAVCHDLGVTVLINGGLDAQKSWLGLSNSKIYPAGVDPHWVEAADVDADGIQDLLVANYGGPDVNNTVTLLRGVGLGNFEFELDLVVGKDQFPISVVASDIDADGDQDVAVVDQCFGCGQLRVYENLGSEEGVGWSGLGAPQVYEITPLARAVRSADIDHDGDLDLLVAHRGVQTMTIARNDGTGVFVIETMTVDDGGELALPIDLDGDRDLDLALVQRNQNRVDLLINDGTGAFGSIVGLTVGVEPKFVASADLDMDGDNDLVIANSYGSGEPGTVSVVLLGPGGEQACSADLNSDERVDVLDLVQLIVGWGACPVVPAACAGDVDCNGAIDVADLIEIINAWGPCFESP